jgi:hypothetical protein
MENYKIKTGSTSEYLKLDNSLSTVAKFLATVE